MTQSDFIQSLGLPFLAHRLRRLSEFLVIEEEPVRRQADLLVPARGSSTMLLLARKGPLTVTQIARQLRLSHPLIIRVVKALEEVGYVASGAEQPDGRSRLLMLTALGDRKVDELERFHDAVAEAYRELFRDSQVDLFAALEAIQPALRDGAVAARIRARLFGGAGTRPRQRPGQRDGASAGRRNGLY